MKYNIAIDFGTTNTLASILNVKNNKVDILEFQDYTVNLGNYTAIPSRVAYYESAAYKIGRKISKDTPQNHIFNRMKLYLSNSSSLKAIPRKIYNNKIDHIRAAKDYLSVLMDIVLLDYEQENMEKLIMTAPVESFDSYRSFLTKLCEKKNIYNYQVIDEATAVALGYDAVVSPDYPYMIVDFGGGTLDINIVRVHHPDSGRKVEVIGKAGCNIGGADIDTWILEHFLKKQDLEKADVSAFYDELIEEIEILKIRLSDHDSANFEIKNKKDDYRISYELSKTELNTILKRNYFANTIQEAIDNAVGHAINKGIQKQEIKKVLLTGGGSQLPEFKDIFKTNFGDKVTLDDEPFSAVIRGACKYVSGTVVEDFLHHNYSLRHLIRDRGIYEYETIVPEGTKFPAKDIKQIIISAPFSGQSELELNFFEVMTNLYSKEEIRDITYDENGDLVVVKDESKIDQSRKVVPLHSSERCSFPLDPPSIKNEERIKLTFHVDNNRILTLDASDLKTQETYFKDYQVARLK